MSKAEELSKLFELKKQGVLSEEEFNQEKAKVLGAEIAAPVSAGDNISATQNADEKFRTSSQLINMPSVKTTINPGAPCIVLDSRGNPIPSSIVSTPPESAAMSEQQNPKNEQTSATVKSNTTPPAGNKKRYGLYGCLGCIAIIVLLGILGNGAPSVKIEGDTAKYHFTVSLPLESEGFMLAGHIYDIAKKHPTIKSIEVNCEFTGDTVVDSYGKKSKAPTSWGRYP